MNQQRKRPARKRPELACPRTVALIGMMGAGKTTIGRRLAPRLGLPFHDADAEIEAAAGMSVSDLFREHGEESFRRGEAQVMARLLEGPPIVLATGGGAILDPETRRLLKERAITVWLKADTDTIVKRATRRNTRPLLREGDPRATIERLLREREPYYSAADFAIESASGPHSETVGAIIEALRPLVGTEGGEEPEIHQKAAE
ncbi:MAG TPA: shikimate kinase [Parvularculaceae bacterium]|nr:shikimate kinase [Caulobacterales bacterium]HPE29781.1 shikimate kinase [Parvularculaceae bacterium]HRX38532.1 shikimate kinase [Parvularculaceae bacterium]